MDLSTIYRSISSNGVTTKIPQIVPDINPTQESKLFSFSTAWRAYQFEALYLSDEYIFPLHRNKVPKHEVLTICRS